MSIEIAPQVKVVVTNQPHSQPNAGIDLVSDVSALPPQEVTSSVPTVKLLAHNETIVGARSSQIY